LVQTFFFLLKERETLTLQALEDKFSRFHLKNETKENKKSFLTDNCVGNAWHVSLSGCVCVCVKNQAKQKRFFFLNFT
jgi:hypothetical protein